MASKDFTIQQLRQYIAVAEELNFRLAAVRLFMSQPPLTRGIQSLERSLGVSLLNRTSRTVALTPAGEAFLPEARRILDAVDVGRRVTIEAASGNAGSLRIGYVESVAFDFLPSLLTAFAEACPTIDLGLYELHTSEQVERLHARTIDVAILRPPVDDRGLDLHPLYTNRLVGVVPSGHALGGQSAELSQFASEPFIVYASSLGNSTYASIVQACLSAGFTPRIGHEATSTPMLMSLVAAGKGVSMVPHPYAFTRRLGIEFVPITDVQPTSSVAIAWRRGEERPVHQALLGMARRTASAIEGASN